MNPQGLASLLTDGKEIIFSSEQGPFFDDEINIIKKEGNYGHLSLVGQP